MQQWADDYHFSVVPQPQTAIRYALAIAPDSTPQQPLVVYIEGDGAAWPSRYHPPPDPTPQTPIAWQLAARDNAAKRAYLARPCQYLTAAQRRRCSRQYWTRKRFAVEVIQQYHHLLDQLKQQTASSRLILTGYSGGGVIATLLAAQRQDVDQLVTVAAPLSVNLWTQLYAASPLSGQDPIKNIEPGQLPIATHWAGAHDAIVPLTVLQHFNQRFGGQLKVMADYDHECCWVENWPTLLRHRQTKETP